MVSLYKFVQRDMHENARFFRKKKYKQENPFINLTEV